MTSTPGSPAVPHDPLASVQSDLAEIDHADLADQPAIYERMHTALTDALGRTVDQPGPGGKGR